MVPPIEADTEIVLFRDLKVGEYFVHVHAHVFEPRLKVSRHRKAEVSHDGTVGASRKSDTRGDSQVRRISWDETARRFNYSGGHDG